MIKKHIRSFKKIWINPFKKIIEWLTTHIKGISNPRILGKALEGNYQTLWRYRVGSYRIIADIKDDIFTVVVVKAGKRNDVYKR